MPDIKRLVYDLIVKTSSDISDDIEEALRRAYESEAAGTSAKSVMQAIIENIELARAKNTPLCQDTGVLNFYITAPDSVNQEELKSEIIDAVREATSDGVLRPNAVNPVTGKNSGDNIGYGSPYFSFERSADTKITIDLMLKGGGSENVSAQYRLPDTALKAGRDLKGVEKCIIDAVYRAQGFGCAPGVIGIGIGGDRSGSYLCAKKQLLRRLDDRNPDPALADLEAVLYDKLNRLEIGPMGFGGRTTVLGVKAGFLHRHPASYFVSMAYVCWVHRRQRLEINL